MADKNIPIALQLYSVRQDCAKSFDNTLKAVADMGYQGVEFAGYYNHSAPELRKKLNDLGLNVAGTHISLDTLQADALPATIDFNLALGNRYLVVPALPAMSTLEEWRKIAEQFNAIAEQLRPHGLKLGYHNHTVEFMEIDGVRPWDFIFDNTANVFMQLDTGNAMHGGADPVPYLRKYPGRAETVHLKEFSSRNPNAAIGEGDVDWKNVLELCETVGGTQWYIVEQESYDASPLDSARACLQALRKMGR